VPDPLIVSVAPAVFVIVPPPLMFPFDHVLVLDKEVVDEFVKLPPLMLSPAENNEAAERDRVPLERVTGLPAVTEASV
jgi:hypothetical protein